MPGRSRVNKCHGRTVFSLEALFPVITRQKEDRVEDGVFFTH